MILHLPVYSEVIESGKSVTESNVYHNQGGEGSDHGMISPGCV